MNLPVLREKSVRTRRDRPRWYNTCFYSTQDEFLSTSKLDHWTVLRGQVPLIYLLLTVHRFYSFMNYHEENWIRWEPFIKWHGTWHPINSCTSPNIGLSTTNRKHPYTSCSVYSMWRSLSHRSWVTAWLSGFFHRNILTQHYIDYTDKYVLVLAVPKACGLPQTCSSSI